MDEATARKYPTIAAYFKSKEKAKRVIDTLDLDFAEGVNAGIKTTLGKDKLVDLKALEELEARQKYENALVDKIVSNARNYMAVEPKAKYDEFQEFNAMYGHVGFGRPQITQVLEKLKGESNLANMLKALEEPFNQIKAMKQALALAKLTSLEEILKYTGTQGRVDPAKLGESKSYMAELLEAYDKIGGVTDKMLEKTPYKLEKKSK